MLRSFLGLAFVVALSLPAEAGVLGSLLTFNGVTDQIATETPAGLAASSTGSSTLNVGDVVYGFLVGTNVRVDIAETNPFTPGTPVVSGSGTPAPFPTKNYAIAMFAGQLAAGPIAGDFFLTTVDTTVNSGFRLFDLVDSSFQPFFSGFEDDAVVMMVSGSTTNGSGDAFGVANTSNTGLEAFTTSNFNADFIATLDGGFFQSVANIAGGEVTGAFQRAGLKIVKDNYGGVEWIDVPVKSIFGIPVITGANLALDNTLVGIQNSNGWNFQTQSSSIRLNAIPEPSSFVTAAILTVGCVVLRRRRKNA